MTITGVKLERFTAFESLDLAPSPGVNVLVGANGTGKTHLMKVAYAACAASRAETGFVEKLADVFMPSGGVGRLALRCGDPSRRPAAAGFFRRRFMRIFSITLTYRRCGGPPLRNTGIHSLFCRRRLYRPV